VKPSICLVIFVTAACSDGTKKTPDAAPVLFTGELIDWDSGSTAVPFCGIFGATFTARGQTATDSSNPNGRFMLNLAPPAVVDITPPTAGSQCLTGMPTYSMPALIVANPAVVASTQLISARGFTTMRQASLGVTLDAAKGHVFVHVDGTQHAVSVSTGSDAAQTWDGTTWGAGAQGINVFFPNVPAGMTDVEMSGAIGVGTVPVEAGKITYVTLVGS
jgi:hypothetical protein